MHSLDLQLITHGYRDKNSETFVRAKREKIIRAPKVFEDTRFFVQG